MMHYTIHRPPQGKGAHMAELDEAGHVITYPRLAAALKRAYTYLPLEPPSRYRPDEDGAYVAVQEWDEDHEPHRQWCISGRE